MNDNQDPQFSNNDQAPETSFKDAIQLLADQLNETPRRKSSISFLNSWFFGYKDVLVSLLNAAFFGVPVFFFVLIVRIPRNITKYDYLLIAKCSTKVYGMLFYYFLTLDRFISN